MLLIKDRLNSAGIKQIIRFEWLEKAANFALSGLSTTEVRKELHEYLMHRKGDGSTETRGETARAQIVNIIMKIWIKPDSDLQQFRDTGLELLRKKGTHLLPVHWAAVSAAYPFWFNVARLVGRLIRLQGQVQKQQIDKRLKEQYGDRETISRCGRQVVRSFIAWNALSDTTLSGCYEASSPIVVQDTDVVAYLIESALRSSGEDKLDLSGLLSAPFFFPFRLPTISGSQLKTINSRLEIQRFAAGEEIVGIGSP